MEKRLVIVESPAKARTVHRYLGQGFLVKASMGHIRDLPKERLGVDVEQDFRPDYEIIPERKKSSQNSFLSLNFTELKNIISNTTKNKKKRMNATAEWIAA